MTRHVEPLHVPILKANELYNINRHRGVKLFNDTVKTMDCNFPSAPFSNEKL